MTINNAVLTPVTPEIVVRMSIDEKIEHGPHILEAKAHFEEGDYTSPGPHATGFLTVFKAENANEESYNLHGHQQKWPSFWTYSVVMLALFYSAVGGWVSLSLSPFYLVLATEWNKDISSIAWLVNCTVEERLYRVANVTQQDQCTCVGSWLCQLRHRPRGCLLWTASVILLVKRCKAYCSCQG